MTALSAMLDELMGKNRNAAPDEKINELHWSDDDVCKHFLCGFCPAELFTNTRSDLGVCSKSHDERTKKNYQGSNRYMKMGYEEDFLRFLQTCWNDVERRIRRNHQRLQLSEEKNQSKQNIGSNSSELDEKITVLNKRIEEMLENIEKLGSEGEVEQAQSIMKLCDQLKEEREQLQAQRGGQISDAFSVQEKQMEVCEVCGAFLIVGDAQSRVDDHLMGKQHMGYAKIKNAIAELKERLTKASEQQRESRRTSKATNHSKSKTPEKSRSAREDKPRDKERDRDRRSRDHRSRDSERRRSRDRDDRRKSDRDRMSSRDRDRRSDPKSSRERKHSRDRESRSRRSHDGDRKDSKHKRSRDRSRSRDRKRSRKSEDRSSDRKSEKRRKSSENAEKKESEKSSEQNNVKKDNPEEVSSGEVVEETIEEVEEVVVDQGDDKITEEVEETT